ncbi:transmembrane emp24 domain-containing protein 1a isoform X2 [Oryzias melastigma]|uniref:Transmembrane p24 trafficking protein 1a n=2 Tax=Oryzias melastigma TaxID=30732 RepID=A0A3B3BIF7_ORYME|nr:transmembrane emp24 domain-containing protein 1a isoform X2 [Oryzias melastigma]
MMAVTARLGLEMLLTLTVGLILGSEAKQHMEFTFILPAGSTECFFQSTTRNDSMEVEYQVIAGSGLDVGFVLVSPSGHRLISDFRNSHGIHTVDPAEDGDYRLCFDNSFSKLSEKMVFFEVVVNSQSDAGGAREDWEDFAVTDSTVDYRLEDIRSRMESVYRHLEKSRQVQALLRAFESRDRYLLEDNLWRVSFWSCINLFVLLTVAVVQIYTLQRLFDNKRVRT